MKKIPSKITKATITKYKSLRQELDNIEGRFYKFMYNLNLFIENRRVRSGHENIDFEDWYDCEFLNSFWGLNAETLLRSYKLKFKIKKNNIKAFSIEDNDCCFKLPLKYLYDIELLKTDIEKYTDKKLKDEARKEEPETFEIGSMEWVKQRFPFIDRNDGEITVAYCFSDMNNNKYFDIIRDAKDNSVTYVYDKKENKDMVQFDDSDVYVPLVGNNLKRFNKMFKF